MDSVYRMMEGIATERMICVRAQDVVSYKKKGGQIYAVGDRTQ